MGYLTGDDTGYSGLGDGSDGGPDLTQSSDSSGARDGGSFGPDTGGFGPDTGGGGGGGGGFGPDIGGAGTGGGPDLTQSSDSSGARDTPTADTGTPGGGAQQGEDTSARDLAAQYGAGDLGQLQAGAGSADAAPDAAAPVDTVRASGAPGAAPSAGGGYGDPLAAGDPSSALTLSQGDILDSQGTGNVPPTVGASRGSMLDPDNADAAAYSERAAELLGPRDYGPGTQLPSADYGATPGPAMAPGTEQADTLAGQQFAELGQGDVPLNSNRNYAAGTGAPRLPADAGPADWWATYAGRPADRPAVDSQTQMDPGIFKDPLGRLAPLGSSGARETVRDPVGSADDVLTEEDRTPTEDVTTDPNEVQKIAQKDQEQAPGPTPGGVGSTQDLVPSIASTGPYPFEFGGYAGAPAQTVVDPGTAVRYDAANPPGGGFASYAPGALFAGVDPGLLGTGAPIATGPEPANFAQRFAPAQDAPLDQNYQPTNNQMLAPGSLNLDETFPTEQQPTQQDVAAQYGATGLGGFQQLMAGGGAPSETANFAQRFAPAEDQPLDQNYRAPFAERFPEAPGPEINTRPFFQSLPDAPGYQLPGTLPNDPAALTLRGSGAPRLPPDLGNLGPKPVTPEIVRPGDPGTYGPFPGGGRAGGEPPSTPGTRPDAPQTPGVPPDTGKSAPSAPDTPLGPLGPGGGPQDSTQLALSEPTPRGGFERGLPPPPQLVNAMVSNASPAVQQAANSLTPAQQSQVSQYAFGLINQYRQMLLNQGGFADPSSPVWQQQILPQVQRQTQQYMLQLTGQSNPAAVQQIVASAA